MRDRQQDFLQELNKVLKEEQIQLQEPMSRHTTFRVGGPADIYVLPQINQVKEVLELSRQVRVTMVVSLTVYIS